MDKEDYKKLSKEQKTKRKLALMQTADDICQDPSLTKRSHDSYHAWIDEQREILGINAALLDWKDKPLGYHLKANPEKFILGMYKMSMDQYQMGKKAFALFPLRRSHVPRHVRFDHKVLDDVLKLGCQNEKAKQKRKEKKNKNEEE